MTMMITTNSTTTNKTMAAWHQIIELVKRAARFLDADIFKIRVKVIR
jgi:hypothetical protein